MFEIGEVIIYSEHGLCQIDDICERTFSDKTKTYYILHPLSAANLKISTPVDNEKVVMLKPMVREEAEELLQTFKNEDYEWIEDAKKRNKEHRELIKTGNRKEIAKVLNTLMRKSHELKLDNKKMHDQDAKFLVTVQDILFKDIALSMKTSFDEIVKKVNHIIEEN